MTDRVWSVTYLGDSRFPASGRPFGIGGLGDFAPHVPRLFPEAWLRRHFPDRDPKLFLEFLFLPDGVYNANHRRPLFHLIEGQEAAKESAPRPRKGVKR